MVLIYLFLHSLILNGYWTWMLFANNTEMNLKQVC